MRSDMDKVLVERPRKRGGPRQLGRPARSTEDLPRLLGMRRGGTKELNEHLGPLAKYLGRQVGRPWNKVFSEMRAHIKPGSTVQEHVLAHVEQFLVTEVEKVTPSPESPCGLRRAPSAGWRRWGLDIGQLYVDPDDGIIKRARRRLKGQPAVATADQPPRPLFNGRLAVVHQGAWFSATLVPYQLKRDHDGAPEAFVIGGMLQSTCWVAGVGDVRPSDKMKLRALEQAYGPGLLPVSPLKLSPRELRFHGLQNAPSA